MLFNLIIDPGPELLKGSSAIWWLYQEQVSGTLGSHKSTFRSPGSEETTVVLPRAWTEGSYLRLKCANLMHFGFMAQGGTARKSAEGVLGDGCRKVVSAGPGPTNLGSVPWATSLGSGFSSV